MYDPDKPGLMEITNPDRDLFSCMRGEHGLAWCLIGWIGGVTITTLLLLGGYLIIAGV